MVESIYFAVVFGVTGYLIAGPLTREGEVLAWWPKLVRWVFRAGADPFYHTKTQELFFKISYGCGKCVSGQLCLWFLFFRFDFSPPIYLLGSIAGAIFISHLIENKM